ncbi:hypothetical protein JAAARDRAFT_146265 [Jaapia argillacea MUCL 33604]|uniref:Uncharacterized protein n=1 Tax=Jaapia argillacea MUCL 33604 TaxID=933084 RepID=A0A067QN60_9AGAM|nr:hypothetical protein JAAARDRAFT_146265 [Jaapia argillacea MUCL 33604]
MLASAFAKAGVGCLKSQTALTPRALWSKAIKPTSNAFSTFARARLPSSTFTDAWRAPPKHPHQSRGYSVISTSTPVTKHLRSLEPRFFSSNGAQSAAAMASGASAASLPQPLPVLSPPSVGRWLLFSGALVFAVIVVGGVTRLTESGLSITEWRPIAGILPPLSHEAWNEEFDKYKATPEFKLLNHSITLDEFKNIFYMEWGHRVLGRLIGITFVVPFAYFALRKKLTASLPAKLMGMTLLIGVQGIIGWYMVKSGLEDSIYEERGVPRVSQYRLALHLGTAFVLYAGMMWAGFAALSDWRYAHGGLWSKVTDGRTPGVVASHRLFKRFSKFSWALTALVFLTALSGAFVAGLDAGLLYNEFPYMGGRLAPPADELMDRAYAKSPDGSDLWWRNIFENPTTTQFNHRLLGITTYVGSGALFATTLLPAYRNVLPPLTTRFAAMAFGMANVQVLLGISTLLYLVPVSLAACHQAGSVALLTLMVHLLMTMRRPGQAAKAWRQAWSQATKKSAKAKKTKSH